jgi:hypothetical protein
MAQTTTAPSTQSSIPATITVGDLQAILADLAERFPAAGPRLQHAAFIATFGRVERSTENSWWVGSERDPNAEYLVLEAQGTCTCQDWQRHGSLSPCKHQLSTLVVQAAEHLDAERHDPTPDPDPEPPAGAAVVEVATDTEGQPIPFSLTAKAMAIVDEYRIRQAARCPDCGTYKQHGDLYCAGDVCEVPAPIVLNLPA